MLVGGIDLILHFPTWLPITQTCIKMSNVFGFWCINFMTLSLSFAFWTFCSVPLNRKSSPLISETRLNVLLVEDRNMFLGHSFSEQNKRRAKLFLEVIYWKNWMMFRMEFREWLFSEWECRNSAVIDCSLIIYSYWLLTRNSQTWNTGTFSSLFHFQIIYSWHGLILTRPVILYNQEPHGPVHEHFSRETISYSYEPWIICLASVQVW